MCLCAVAVWLLLLQGIINVQWTKHDEFASGGAIHARSTRTRAPKAVVQNPHRLSLLSMRILTLACISFQPQKLPSILGFQELLSTPYVMPCMCAHEGREGKHRRSDVQGRCGSARVTVHVSRLTFNPSILQFGVEARGGKQGRAVCGVGTSIRIHTSTGGMLLGTNEDCSSWMHRLS